MIKKTSILYFILKLTVRLSQVQKHMGIEGDVAVLTRQMSIIFDNNFKSFWPLSYILRKLLMDI